MAQLTGVWLTTVDNPYDPVEDYDKWKLFDKEHGYDCEEILARNVFLSDQLTEAENNVEIEDAIDQIIIDDPLNIYTKVKKTFPSIE